METIITEDPADLAVAAANAVAAEVEASDRLLLGLAGGSTPEATHRLLAARPLAWDHVEAWLPDERWVAPDDEASNQRMARMTLADPVGLSLIAPDTTLSNPYTAAEGYADEIVPRMVDPGVRRVTMLGIGADGHTASLFPGTQALDVESIAYVANLVPSLDAWRLTATFDLLGQSDVVLFLVSGEAKADAVAAIAQGEDLPAGRVTARESVVWMLDDAAASRLH
ncbi:MAG: 6-phosphogluconolactonase [Acidimicrobiia bacterium]|nr:6-phosphogluconolactonase [Acidimicrobiia bacterium]